MRVERKLVSFLHYLLQPFFFFFISSGGALVEAIAVNLIYRLATPCC